jgi:integrase
MSVFKDPRSPYWRFDFQYRGDRFFGPTKVTTRREAEALERVEREKAKGVVAARRAARMSLRLDDVFGRYWQDVGQFHAGARQTERELGYWLNQLSKDTLITEVTTDDVARVVARRRVDQGRDGLLKAVTVNDTIRRLRKVFGYCKDRNVRFENPPNWRKLFLPEPTERVRELVDDEAARLAAAYPEDLAPFFTFAALTGLRFTECRTLRWTEVDWAGKQIRKPGKGGRLMVTPITSTVREILWPLRAHHPEFVFTHVAQRNRRGRLMGDRYPLHASTAKKAWVKLRAEAGVVGFRFHDFRHDVGTKVLRFTGNLKLTQKALNHSSIRTTLRYAHVLDGEVADALEGVAAAHQKSPKNPTTLRKVA